MPALLALLLIAAPAPAPAPDATLEELNRAYQQACDTRAYGQFDDVCGGLKDQIARYRADLRRRPRAKLPSEPAAAPSPATVPPEVVGATTAPSHDPLKAAPPK